LAKLGRVVPNEVQLLHRGPNEEKMNKQEKKFKDEQGVSLSLEGKKDSLSLLLKKITKKAVELIEKKEYDKAKSFLMLNFDL
tara:strand:- start:283 stop:528 length:246 start_codon:yes stop_codon:yes gene_type:complete